jgi:hypothetical protein
MSDSSNECRNAFEAWYSCHNKMKCAPPRYKDGYMHKDPEVAWAAWQAAWNHRNEASDVSAK